MLVMACKPQREMTINIHVFVLQQIWKQTILFKGCWLSCISIEKIVDLNIPNPFLIQKTVWNEGFMVKWDNETYIPQTKDDTEEPRLETTVQCWNGTTENQHVEVFLGWMSGRVCTFSIKCTNSGTTQQVFCCRWSRSDSTTTITFVFVFRETAHCQMWTVWHWALVLQIGCKRGGVSGRTLQILCTLAQAFFFPTSVPPTVSNGKEGGQKA